MAKLLIPGFNSSQANATVSFAAAGLMSTNCAIVYLVKSDGSGFLSSTLGGGINAINGFVADKDYLLYMKQPLDVDALGSGGGSTGGTVLVDADNTALQV